MWPKGLTILVKSFMCRQSLENIRRNESDNYHEISFKYFVNSFLRSYDTLYRRHLLSIGQTKIICYNLPDITGQIEKKLISIEYVPILIIPAYYK